MRSILVLVSILTIGCSRGSDPATVKAKAVTAVPGKQKSASYTPEFWKHWGDGRAEMNGYDLTFPRYGRLRKGVAVAIFVTETFSSSLRVKSDPGRRSPADEIPVMKLNLVKDYQTGVYDYNNMASIFVALEPTYDQTFGWPSKVSFSSQEWCGHVYGQVLFQKPKAMAELHSYFDGEADSQRQLDVPWNGTSEDILPLWARQIAFPFQKHGGKYELRLLTSLETARGKHIPLTWDDFTLAYGRQSQNVTVPAGTFEVDVSTATRKDGFMRTFYVETQFPHRLIKWETSEGEKAELLGSDRMKYWEMNQEGGEEALKRLGLHRRGPRMP